MAGYAASGQGEIISEFLDNPSAVGLAGEALMDRRKLANLDADDARHADLTVSHLGQLGHALVKTDGPHPGGNGLDIHIGLREFPAQDRLSNLIRLGRVRLDALMEGRNLGEPVRVGKACGVVLHVNRIAVHQNNVVAAGKRWTDQLVR